MSDKIKKDPTPPQPSRDIAREPSRKSSDGKVDRPAPWPSPPVKKSK